MLRPRLIETIKFCGCRDRDSSRLGISVVVETETHRDWEILWLSRPRLIETGKFCGVETETHRDWEILWLSRPRLIETGNFCGCRDRDQPRLNKSCRDRDFIESLADLWFPQLHEFSPFAPLISKFSLFWPKIYKIVAIFAKSHAIFREEVAGRP